MINNIIIMHEWGFDSKSIEPLAQKLKENKNVYVVDSSYYGTKLEIPNINEKETLAIGCGIGFAKLLNLGKSFSKYVSVSSLAKFNCSEHNKRHIELLIHLIKENKTFEALNGFLLRSGVKKYETTTDSINTKALLQDLELMLNYNFIEQVAKNESNTLAILGSKDLLVSYNDFNKQFASNKKLIVENASHNLVMENVAEIAQHIQNFIKIS